MHLILIHTHPNGKFSIKISPQWCKPNICSKDCLGLTLARIRTRGGWIALNTTLSMTTTNFGMYAKVGLRILVSIWINTRMQGLNFQMMQRCKTLHPMSKLNIQILMMYGVPWMAWKVSLTLPHILTFRRYFTILGSQAIMSFMYLFVFAADGTISICCFNLPGATHDSTAADSGFIYDKLGKVYQETGLKCTVNSTFRCKILLIF